MEPRSKPQGSRPSLLPSPPRCHANVRRVDRAAVPQPGRGLVRPHVVQSKNEGENQIRVSYWKHWRHTFRYGKV